MYFVGSTELPTPEHHIESFRSAKLLIKNIIYRQCTRIDSITESVFEIRTHFSQNFNLRMYSGAYLNF